MKVHFSSATNEWQTPPAVFAQLHRRFQFTLDPCATEENHKCEKYFTKSDDGLSKSWANERVFMNPPYGREIGHWIRKAYLETSALVVCLIPSRTDTKYWHEYCMKSDEVWFIEGRIKFGDGCKPAPFPSSIVVFNVGRSNNRLHWTAGMLPVFKSVQARSLIQSAELVLASRQ